VGKPERLVADVALRIAEIRRSRGITQEELAARLGVTTRYVARLEAGANVTVTTIAYVANALRIEPGELFEAPRSRERARPGRPRAHPEGAVAANPVKRHTAKRRRRSTPK
jgi:transcriptional regulator with XRE-family HTH domain